MRAFAGPALGALLLGAVAPATAAGQDVDRDGDRARLERLLRRWTAAARPTRGPVRAGRPLRETAPPEPHALLCRGRASSCECGGLPASPRGRPTNMREVGRRLSDCAGRRLRRAAPHPAGRVEVDLEIGPGGRVVSARLVSNGTGDEELGVCVVRALRALRVSFEVRRLELPIRMRFPVVFAASAAPDEDEEPPLRAPPAPRASRRVTPR